MPSANANSLRGQIRRLIEQNGKLHRHELRALLPGVPRGLDVVPVSSDAIGCALRKMVSGQILTRTADDGFILGRPVLCSGRAGKLGRIAAAKSNTSFARTPKKADRQRDFATRQQENAAAAQAITRRDLGQRDQPANDLPCSDAFIAANARKPGAYEVLTPGKVGPSSQFRALENVT